MKRGREAVRVVGGVILIYGIKIRQQYRLSLEKWFANSPLGRFSLTLFPIGIQIPFSTVFPQIDCSYESLFALYLMGRFTTSGS